MDHTKGMCSTGRVSEGMELILDLFTLIAFIIIHPWTYYKNWIPDSKMVPSYVNENCSPGTLAPRFTSVLGGLAAYTLVVTSRTFK